MAEFHNAPEIRQTETLPPKGVSKETTGIKKHAGTKTCVEFVQKNYGDLPAEDKKDMRVDESIGFLSANPGASDLFARVVKHCESKGMNGELDKACQNGLPVSVSDISKLAEKFEIARTEVAERKNEVAEKDEKEKDAEKMKLQKIGQEMIDRLPADLKSKYLSQFEGLRDGTLKGNEAKAFAKQVIEELKSSLEAAKASGGDTSKAQEDLRFFAEKFRDLGVIDHAEFRKIFEESGPKSFDKPNKPQDDGRTALANNYVSTGDGRTYFALDRRDADGRKFDEFVRLSPDGKTASKEIVGKYGYSITLEPLPLETGKAAEMEAKTGELTNAQNEKGRIENRAKYVEETFGQNGSKIPSPDDPKYGEFKEAIEKLAKDRGIPPDPSDPKATLETVKQSLKSTYAQALEKNLKIQNELQTLQNETSTTADANEERNERNARDAVDFLDKTGIAALGPKATEQILARLGAPGCENGKPADLEKLLKNKIAIAEEFRAFVTETLDAPSDSLFEGTTPPLSLRTVDAKNGNPVNLVSDFSAKGLLKDGNLDLSKISLKQKEAATA